MRREGRARIMERGAVLLISALLSALCALPLNAQTLCEGSDYQRALCSYRAGRNAEAERLFQAIADTGAQHPETLKARYFLARSLMKQRKWQPASEQFIRIYRLSRGFYDEWSCDFLLGECRRALGLE